MLEESIPLIVNHYWNSLSLISGRSLKQRSQLSIIDAARRKKRTEVFYVEAFEIKDNVLIIYKDMMKRRIELTIPLNLEDIKERPDVGLGRVMKAIIWYGRVPYNIEHLKTIVGLYYEKVLLLVETPFNGCWS